MKPAPFRYRRAASVDDALSALHADPENTKLMAGGQSLVPMLNMRLARPGTLVDVSGLDALAYLEPSVSELRIGALTTHAQVEHHPDVLTGFEVVREACRLIGYPPIRENGTVGGSLVHSDPTGEWCLVATLLDAVVTLVGPGGLRHVEMTDFVIGPFMTSIAEDEMLLEVRFPRPYDRGAFLEATRQDGDFAIAAAAAAFDVQNGRIARSRLAVAGLASTPVRVAELEAALDGIEVEDAASLDSRLVRAALQSVSSARREEHLVGLATELVRRCVVVASSSRKGNDESR